MLTNLENNLEIFNEFMVLISIYHVLLFSDFVIDVEDKYTFGWSLCFAIGFQVFVNLSVIVVISFNGAIKKLKLRFKKKELQNKADLAGYSRLNFAYTNVYNKS